MDCSFGESSINQESMADCNSYAVAVGYPSRKISGLCSMFIDQGGDTAL